MRPGRGHLSHRRRCGADQPRTGRGAARRLRRRRGHDLLGRGPEGPRPPLLARRHPAAWHGLLAGPAVRGGPAGHRALVCGKPRLVGAAEGGAPGGGRHPRRRGIPGSRGCPGWRRALAMTRWLVTGADGMLGQDLLALLRREGGQQAHGLAHADLDVTDATAVRDTFRRLRPEVAVNCAAWTAVDDAESREEQALAVNGRGPANLAAACAASGARLFQLSTDYVFGGTARQPYPEDAVPDPGTAYGRTKLAGEHAVLSGLPDAGYVVRTAWLYGARR